MQSGRVNNAAAYICRYGQSLRPPNKPNTGTKGTGVGGGVTVMKEY